MSEDQNRDPEGRRDAPDIGGLFSERPGGRSGRGDAEGQGDAAGQGGDGTKDGPTLAAAVPPLDEEAVAKHRAAKQARIRRRREDVRRQQAAADGKDTAGPAAPGPGPGPGPAAPAKQPPKPGGKKGSALPALRPDIKPDTPALRAERVEAIRRDLVRRRRRKGGGMLLKLWLFVLLPTLAVAWFLWFEAANLYKSESSFVVQSSDAGAAGGGGGLLGAFLGGGGGSLYDPIAVQTYILSRDVLRKLDADHGWIAHFQDPDLDFWHGLPPGATFEDAYSHYQQMVTVSYDPTEGIIEMAMIAADPETARRFSDAVIGYAEERVDQLTDRLQRDSVANAERYLAEAEVDWQRAQAELAKVQKEAEIFSVEGEVSAKMSLMTSLQGQLAELEGKLANLLRVTGASDPRVQRLEQQVATKQAQVAELRASIAGEGRQETLADANSALMTAKLGVETAALKFNSALEQLRIARASAENQTRYLSIVTRPSLPDEANFPKKPEMTALAFLAFLGFYIIGSLTISLIREQASI